MAGWTGARTGRGGSILASLHLTAELGQGRPQRVEVSFFCGWGGR